MFHTPILYTHVAKQFKDICIPLDDNIIAIYYPFATNRLVAQMRVTLVASREPAGKLWPLCKVLYVFEQKTQYLLIHAEFTNIVIFSHIGNVPLMIS